MAKRAKAKVKRIKKLPFKYKGKVCPKLCTVKKAINCYANHYDGHCPSYLKEKRGQ